jgi:ornithine cyclodeaminase
MRILVLNEQDIINVFTMQDAIQADKDALEIYSKGGSVTPLRTNIAVPKEEGQSLAMPGYAAEANALGVKIVSVYPNNIKKGLTSVPATMVLQNEDTGEVNAILDGTFLTRIRTGAVSGAATDLLAKKDSKIFALFGTGGQAETQLEAVLTVRGIEEVRVFDLSKERAQDFADKMAEKFNGKFKAKYVVAKSSDDAIVDADIITSVTTTKTPVFNGKLVKKGAHINGVGSFTPFMHEIDEYILLNADKVYVDTRNGVLNESGDFIIPISEGKCTEDVITGELGELILGKTIGRESDEEITFFKTVGSGVLDVVTARRIYEKAVEKKAGQIIEF